MPERMQRPDVEGVGQLAASGEGSWVTRGLKVALEANSKTNQRQHGVWESRGRAKWLLQASRAMLTKKTLGRGLLCSLEGVGCPQNRKKSSSNWLQDKHSM